MKSSKPIDAFERWKKGTLDLQEINSSGSQIPTEEFERIRQHQKKLVEAAIEVKFNQLKNDIDTKLRNWRNGGVSEEQIVKELYSEMKKYQHRQSNKDGNFDLSELPHEAPRHIYATFFDPRWQALMKGKYNSEFIPHDWNDPENPLAVYPAQHRYIKYLSNQLELVEKPVSMRQISLYHFYAEVKINTKNQESIARDYGHRSKNSGKKLGDVYRSILNPEERLKGTTKNQREIESVRKLLEDNGYDSAQIISELRIVRGKINQK